MSKKLGALFAACVFAFALIGLRFTPAHASSPIYPDPSASPFPQGCQYNATPPTIASGSTTAVQCDSIGRPLGSGNAAAPAGLPIAAAQYARTGATGSITTGGTAQNWASAGAIVHGCMIQNTSAGAEFIRMDGSAATASSLQLVAKGGYYECPLTAGPSGAASIYGATTGQTYYSEVW